MPRQQRLWQPMINVQAFGKCPRCGSGADWRGHCAVCLIAGTLRRQVVEIGPAPAKRLGAFTLLEEIGRGGMGRVWRARQDGLEREVALKTLRAGTFAEGSARDRFWREAEAAARLRHPGIVTVHEVGEADGELFLAMELVRGGNLAIHLGRGPMIACAAAELLRLLSDAVEYAHKHGVIHRDLKPSNILLDAEHGNTPRLTDFGIALLVDGAEATLTLPMEGFGTLAYLAPEQVAGRREEQGLRTDVYGLGAVLFHCLTGRAPQIGENVPSLLRAVVEVDPPSPRTLVPNLPHDLETICLKCLEKDPRKRYASAADLRDDLARFIAREPVRARPVGLVGRGWRWSRRHPTIAGLGAALLACIGLFSSGTAWQLARIREANQKLRATLNQRNVETAGDLLQKGEARMGLARLALVLRENPQNRSAALLIANALYGATWPMPVQTFGQQFVDAVALAISPDNRLVSTLDRSGTITVWSIKSGQAVAPSWPSDLTNVTSLNFSENSQSLELRSSSGLARRWSTNGAAIGDEFKEPITGEIPPDFALPTPVESWCLSQELDRAVTLHRDTVGNPTVTLWDVGHKTPITNAFADEELPSVNRFVRLHGELAFVTFRNTAIHWRRGLDGGLIMAPLEMGRLIEDVVVSPDARYLAVIQKDAPVTVWEFVRATTSPAHRQLDGMVRRLEFSPGSETLVVGTSSDKLYWLNRSDLSNQFASPNESDYGFSVAFLEKGRGRMTASQAGKIRFFRGTNALVPAQTVFAPGQIDAFGLSPDQEWVAVGTTNQYVAIWNTRTMQPYGQPVTLSPHSPQSSGIRRVFDLKFSPDSRTLAVASAEHGAVVFEIPSLRIRHRIATNAPMTSVAFSRDNRYVAFGSMANCLFLLDVAAADPKPCVLVHSDKVLSLEFDPNQPRLVAACQDGTVRVWSVPDGALRLDLRTEGKSSQWVGFSPDGSALAAVSFGGTLWRWDSEYGIPLGKPLRLSDRKLVRAKFAPDGHTMAVAAISGDVWTISEPFPSGPTPAWLPDLAEGVAGTRIHPDGSIERILPEQTLAFRELLTRLPTDQSWRNWVDKFAVIH